jgi:hypothetical protein
MGSMLKFLQCVKFISFHTLVISLKLFKKFGDKVKYGKNPCPSLIACVEGPTTVTMIVVDGVDVDIINQPLVMEK